MNYIKLLIFILALAANTCVCQGQIKKIHLPKKPKTTKIKVPNTPTKAKGNTIKLPNRVHTVSYKGIKTYKNVSGMSAKQITLSVISDSKRTLAESASKLSSNRNNIPVNTYLKNRVKNQPITTNKVNAQNSKPQSSKSNSVAKKDFMKMSGVELEAAVKKEIGVRSYEEIVKVVPNKNVANTIARDIANDPNFAGFLKRDPNMAKAYGQAFDSELRTDKKTLRWIGYRSNEFADSRPGYSKRYGNGDMIKLSDSKGGTTIISDNKTGEVLGTMNKDRNIVYVNQENPKLLNIGLMRNTDYVIKEANITYTTGNYGRNIKTTKVYPANKHDVIPVERKSYDIQDFRKAKQAKETRVSTKDDGGHTIGISVGGSNEAINIDPQNKSLNRGSYENFEKTLSSILKDEKNKGKEIVYTVEKTYPEPQNGHLSYRPSTYKCTVTVDGVVVKQETFLNTFEM